MTVYFIEAFLALVEKWAVAYISRRQETRKQADAPLTKAEELSDINKLP